MQSSEAPSSGNLRQHWVLLAILAALTLLTYVSTFAFKFIYDDHGLAENPHYFTDLGWIPEYFKHPFTLNYYRPLVMIWFLFNRLAFGLHPAGWHVALVLLHIAVSLVAYLCAYRLTRSLGLAAITAAIFAVHPAHVESVAWVSGVPDPLLAIFAFLAFISYLRFREDGRWSWLIASLFTAALAMLVKEGGIVVPLLIGAHALIYSVGSVGARLRSTLLYTLPTAVVAALYLALRAHVLAGVAHPVGVNTAQMLLAWPRVALFYVKHLVWPTQLSITYDMKATDTPSFANFGLPVVILAIVVAIVGYLSRFIDKRLLIFGVAWTAIPVLPALYLRAFNTGDIVHDRYLYLSVFGFALIVAALIERLPDLTGRFAGVKATSLLTAVLVVALLAGSTFAEQVHYADDLKLFYRAVHIAPRSEGAWTALAWQLFQAGRYEEAYIAYRNAIAINEKFWLAHSNFGYILLQLNDLDQAENELSRAVALNPYWPPAQLQLAITRARKGNLPEALRTVDQGIKLNPKDADLHYGRAYIMEALHRPTEERQELEAAVRLDPDHVAARARLRALNGK
jgi:tetratricopeptide (TPR) repeat protein